MNVEIDAYTPGFPLMDSMRKCEGSDRQKRGWRRREQEDVKLSAACCVSGLPSQGWCCLDRALLPCGPTATSQATSQATSGHQWDCGSTPRPLAQHSETLGRPGLLVLPPSSPAPGRVSPASRAGVWCPPAPVVYSPRAETAPPV